MSDLLFRIEDKMFEKHPKIKKTIGLLNIVEIPNDDPLSDVRDMLIAMHIQTVSGDTRKHLEGLLVTDNNATEISTLMDRLDEMVKTVRISIEFEKILTESKEVLLENVTFNEDMSLKDKAEELNGILINIMFKKDAKNTREEDLSMQLDEIIHELESEK